MARHFATLLRTACTAVVLPVALVCSGCGGGGGSDGGSSSGDEFPAVELAPVDIDAVAPLPAERVVQGGATTEFNRTALAFENPAPNLNSAEAARHLVGDRNFGAVFVSPPAIENPGLGPLFNNSSCEGCHTKNGRGQPVFGVGGLGSQAVLRISSGDGLEDSPGGSRNVGDLGTQLQDHAIFGATPEGTVALRWDTESGSYADGTRFELRRPNVTVQLPDGGELGPEVATSLRTAPPVFGLGLLEAINDTDILALADPSDADGDGISGRPNLVFDFVLETQAVGKFGRKANRRDLFQQAAGAYVNDIGVSNPLFPAPDGSEEVSGDVLTSVEFYVQTLAVPNSSGTNDEETARGEKEFVGFKCASCHTPEFTTGDHPIRGLSRQRIFPYTDLLLHDMGPGLADNRTDFQADGSEWKTPPLWGIGVTATILLNTATFLHDGRARSLEEAILWHGGEALESRERFRQASAADRAALIKFLRTL